MYKSATPEQAKQIMDTRTNYTLLDVRTPQEFKEGHIPGAKLMPNYDIIVRAPIELPDKQALILVYCQSGSRSLMACRELTEMGYTNVVNIGGIMNWPYEITYAYEQAGRRS